MSPYPLMENDEGGQTIQAVATAFEILEKIVALGGARLVDLEREVDLSKSAIHNHLRTLQQLGYVSKDGRVYQVGLNSVTLGGYARDKHELYSVAWPAVNRIAEETEELALIAVEHQGKSMYLYQMRGQEAVTTDSYLGVQLQMHCTGTGKAMLSQMPTERVEEILSAEELVQFTDNTITDPDELMDELETIRETKIAYDDEERIAGMRGVASPITNRQTGGVAGALSITGPTSRVKGDRFETGIPEVIKRAAEMIEVDYTYS